MSNSEDHQQPTLTTATTTTESIEHTAPAVMETKHTKDHHPDNDDDSDSDEPNQNPFALFDRVKKNISSASGRKKSSTTAKQNRNGRRVVKAIYPAAHDTTSALETDTTAADMRINIHTDNGNGYDERDEKKNDDVNVRSPVGKNPSVQTEVLREKTEQWRQERLDSTAAIRKENKERGVMEHRRKASVGSEREREEHVQDDSHTTTTTVPVPNPIPPILTVAPKFPEHKRKAGGTESEDHSGKRTRVVEEEVEAEKPVGTDAVDVGAGGNEHKTPFVTTGVTCSWKINWAGVGVVVVAATAVIVALKLSRQR